jgi:hypothetical protein
MPTHLLENVQRALLARLLAWRPIQVFLVTCLGGCLLAAFSVALNVHLFTALPEYGGGRVREVGYFAAPNWSIIYTFLFPLAASIMTAVIQKVHIAIDNLYKDEMVRDEATKEPIRTNEASSVWRGTPGLPWWLFWSVVGIVPAALSWPEWFNNNYRRLFGWGPKPESWDYDWGLAGIMPPGAYGDLFRALNAALDFLAFTYQGVLLASLLAFFLYLLDVGRVLPGNSATGALFPNLRTQDKRQGFGLFEDTLRLMLLASVVIYVMCYSVTINRIYMHHNSAPSLLALVNSDLSKAFVNVYNLPTLRDFLLEGVPQTYSRQQIYGTVGYLLAITASICVLIYTVRSAARRARAEARRYYESVDAKSLFGLSVADERERARNMVTWPLGWLRLNLLLATGVLALCSLWWYRFAIVFVALATVRILAYFLSEFATLFKDTDD